jgi:hypothetical protein
MKTCTACKVEKSLEEFYRDAKFKGGRAAICKPCKNKKTMAWRENNAEKYNAYMRQKNREQYPVDRLRRYGMTLEQHAAMLEAQGGLCAICRKPPSGKRPLVVDHCHASGTVRGLLCYGCNRALHVLDTPDLLAKANAYLKKS